MARMVDTRLLKCVMFGELRGAGCVEGQKKEWIGCFLSFRLNTDQWTTAAQGEMDRCRDNQGWTTACSRIPERHGKDQGEDSPKQCGLVLVRSPLLAMSFFPVFFVPLPFFLRMESTPYVFFLPDGVFKEFVFFLPCDHGLDFRHQLLIM